VVRRYPAGYLYLGVPVISKEDIKRIRKTLNRSTAAMAEIVGVTQKTWEKWEVGVKPQHQYRPKLDKLLAHIDGRKGRE
jgi:DNA-binding transcriptional regulator YiaG